MVDVQMAQNQYWNKKNQWHEDLKTCIKEGRGQTVVIVELIMYEVETLSKTKFWARGGETEKFSSPLFTTRSDSITNDL